MRLASFYPVEEFEYQVMVFELQGYTRDEATKLTQLQEALDAKEYHAWLESTEEA